MVLLWFEMANSPLVTENHPERGLGFMCKGCVEIKGSWLRADRVHNTSASFPDPRKPLAGRGAHVQKWQHHVSFLPSAARENSIKK